MTWALGQHPNIQPMAETAWIAAQSVGAYQAYKVGSARGRYSHLSNISYPLERFFIHQGRAVNEIVHDVFAQRLIKEYGPGALPDAEALNTPGALLLKRSETDPKQRWVDGPPLNTFYTWALAQMFPDAKFLHHIRAPQSVVASLERFDALGQQSRSWEQALSEWTHHATAAWDTEQALGSENVFRVDFRRLESDSEALLSDILTFLGEDMCFDCLQPLGKRWNSSGTHHIDLTAELSELATFHDAQALYAEIIDAPICTSADHKALASLKARFETLADNRPLIGG